MSLQQAFLADILEHPEDDAPRLIYADWLDENGDPTQAEFIRAQVDLARLDEDDPRRDELARRADELREGDGVRWAETLLRLRALNWEFARGLPVRATWRAEDFLRFAPEVIRRTPIRQVRVVVADGVMAELRDLRALEQFTHLDLSPPGLARLGRPLGPAMLHQLASSPHLGGLRNLNLANTGLDNFVLAALTHSEALAQLEELDLSHNRLTSSTAMLLASARFAGRLETLHLNHTELPGVEQIGLANSGLPRLAVLSVGHLARAGDLFQALAGASSPLPLRRLTVSASQGPTEEDARALAASPVLDTLESLTAVCQFTPSEAWVVSLLASPRLARVRWLCLERRRFVPAEYRGTNTTRFTISQPEAHYPGLPALTWTRPLSRLTLRGGSLSPGDVRAFAAGSSAPDLEQLDLRAVAIEGDALELLLRAPRLARLRQLDLRPENQTPRSLPEEQCRALLACPASVAAVYLHGRDVTSAQIEALEASPVGAVCVPSLAQLRAEIGWLGAWPKRWRQRLGESRDILFAHVLQLRDPDIEELASLPPLARVRRLHLDSRADLTVAALRALAHSPHVGGLRRLSLANTNMNSLVAEAFAGNPTLTGLLELDLGGCPVGDTGVKELSRLPALSRLRVLRLCWTRGATAWRLTSVAARALASSAHLGGLIALDLAGNRIDDTGARALADSPHLKHLLFLDVDDNDIGPAGMRALERRFGPYLRTLGGPETALAVGAVQTP